MKTPWEAEFVDVYADGLGRERFVHVGFRQIFDSGPRGVAWFRRLRGMSPREYRAQQRLSAGG